MDLNYFGYFKITVISTLAIILIKVKRLDLFTKRSNLKKLFLSYNYSLSLFTIIIITHLLLASFGAHNQRYISVLIPFIFILVAVSWDKLINVVTSSFRARSEATSRGIQRSDTNWQKPLVQLISILILALLVFYSHPNFTNHLSGFIKEIQSDYYGPIEGIVNTISGVKGLKRIDPDLPKQPNILIATNFEDGAIYAYFNNQFLNSLAPTEKYRTGDRLPDWVIIRQHWGQENYLQSFLQTGNYQKIATEYCDLPYENVYLVRTHLFQTPPTCQQGKLTLYRLVR